MLKAMGTYCFVIVFCFSFLQQRTAEIFLRHGTDVKLLDGQSFFSTGTGTGLPLSPDFIFSIEPGDEEVSIDELASDFDGDGSLGYTVPDRAFVFSIEKASFSNFISRIGNRKQVSMLILHHSWKSFLS